MTFGVIYVQTSGMFPTCGRYDLSVRKPPSLKACVRVPAQFSAYQLCVKSPKGVIEPLQPCSCVSSLPLAFQLPLLQTSAETRNYKIKQ